jgi:hypothetical protein
MFDEAEKRTGSVFNDREGIILCADALASIGEEEIAALVRKIKANEENSNGAPES